MTEPTFIVAGVLVLLAVLVLVYHVLHRHDLIEHTPLGASERDNRVRR